MKSFPKKYDPKELRNRSKLYKQNTDLNKDFHTIFSTNILPSWKKLSYRDFFSIYLNDFFDKKKLLDLKRNNENQNSYEQLFIISWNQLNSISSSYEFFLKKNQSLSQIWPKKLERHIISSTKKYINANHKILDSYSSSKHKIYLPDLDLYTYILNTFHTLWDAWKIINKTKIWYRSFNLQTSVPLEKISRKEEKIPCYTLKYFIWTKWDALYIPIEWDIDACCWDVALLVHPKDKRYNKHIWKKAIIPLCNRQIPIIWDENVNIAANNWIQRVCPFCDEASIELAKKFWLPTNIYTFNKQWLYTQYIHEPAFVWKKRSKYYDNIVEFIDDIGNIAEIWEKITKVPYLEEIKERLTPYKIDQLVIDLKDEKENIIDSIFEKNINYPKLNDKFSEFMEEYDFWPSEENILHDDTNGIETYSDDEITNDEITDNDTANEEEKIINKKRQKIINELDKYLPDSLVCNSQIPFWWKIPLIYDSENGLTFFDLEKDCLKWKQEPLQFCFNFVLLSLFRLWILEIGSTYWDTEEYKVCEYNKFDKILLENEKKIEYFIQQLTNITWEKHEYKQFMEMIENLSENENSDSKELSDLIKNCKFLKHKWIRLLSDIKRVIGDVIDPDFIQLCIPCYLKWKGIDINQQKIFTKESENNIFKELLIQQLLLWSPIFNELLLEDYNIESEFLWNKELTKYQLEQSQRDFFSLYWENPVRLNFLINKTFNQKEIILNSIFLKQIRNAIRLCIQKDFLPKDIETCLNNQPDEFDDYDIFVLNKLNELLTDLKIVETYQEFMNFFNNFKENMQNVFFSRYLEIIKIHPTKNVQFVCSYFFNFLITILYPIVPEFTEALQYLSERNFLIPINSVNLKKSVNYNTNMLYDTFIKIKQLKLENNIQQHKSCNIFIKSTPTICEIFAENEQIFKNYFHISDINYIRLHEANPLWYEIFSDELITIGIQNWNSQESKEKDSIETIERDIKNLEDKLNLLKERLQMLPEWEQRTKAEEEYGKTKEEIENLTIKHSLLSSK